MNNEDDDEFSLKSALFGIIIAIVLTVLLMQLLLTTGVIDTEEIERQGELAEAYCGAVYESSEVYNANAVGGHGGLHCVDNDYGPHLHEIPQKYLERAYAAQQSGEELGWTVDTAREHAKEKPDEIPVLGVYPRDLVNLLGVTGALALAVIGIGWWQRGDE